MQAGYRRNAISRRRIISQHEHISDEGNGGGLDAIAKLYARRTPTMPPRE